MRSKYQVRASWRVAATMRASFARDGATSSQRFATASSSPPIARISSGSPEGDTGWDIAIHREAAVFFLQLHDLDRAASRAVVVGLFRIGLALGMREIEQPRAVADHHAIRVLSRGSVVRAATGLLQQVVRLTLPGIPIRRSVHRQATPHIRDEP